MEMNYRLNMLWKLLTELEYFMNDKNPAIEILVQNLVYEIAKEMNETLEKEEK